MIAYITQALNNFATKISNLEISFEAGDLVEVRETEPERYLEPEAHCSTKAELVSGHIEYVEVEAPQPKPCDVLSKEKKQRTKAIVTGVYGKQKGEKISNWRRRIIKIYNEIKGVNYNPESKFYTTARINEFIKEIQEIERAKTKEESFYYNSEV